MSQKQRINRRKRKRKMRLALFGFVLVYILFRSVPSLFAIGPKTELPEKYSVDEKIETEGIIIKDESVYLADGEGRVNLVAKEGERVPVGAKISELTLISDTSQLKDKLNEVENKIAVLTETNNENSLSGSYEAKIEDSVNSIIDDLQASISNGNYNLARQLKDKLSSYHERGTGILEDDTLIGYSLESLEKEKQELEKQISNNIINYYSREAGIVSYKIDGYESQYSIINKDVYGYSNFQPIKSKHKITTDGDSVKVRQPIFKIINNFQWYILIKVEDNKMIESYEEGNSILLSGKDIIGELRGYIETISFEGNKGTILCKFNRDFKNYYDKRHVKLDIIKNQFDSFRIRKKSMVDKDGLKGVYIKDINGIIRFRPIEIISEDDEYIYISTGDKNSYIYIGEGDEKSRTVRQFDEILLNPTNLEEGMIINWQQGGN